MSDNTGFGDPLAWFHEAYERLYTQLFWREMLGLDENDQPRYKGLKGIAANYAMFDELPEINFWGPRNPRLFTPKEFETMWNSWSSDQKFNYVFSLIS